jgi:hypothetical protein
MRATAFLTGLMIVASSGCVSHLPSFSSHWDKCRVTYQSYLPVALPSYEGHVETLVGHPGLIPKLAARLTHGKNAPLTEAALFDAIRRELTAQLRHDDYALIGWLGAVGNGRCNFVQLEEALASRAKKWGGDTVVIVSHRLQPKPPFTYILTGDARLTFYGHTDHPVYTPSPAHAGVARFPQAEAFVLRSCSGFDKQAEDVLALSAEQHDLFESRWRTFEAEAAHGQDAIDRVTWLVQTGDNLIVGSEVPLPRRKLCTKPSATWSNFAQRRGLLERRTRADIDERVIIQNLVVRQVTGDLPRSKMRGRYFWASGPSEVVE